MDYKILFESSISTAMVASRGKSLYCKLGCVIVESVRNIYVIPVLFVSMHMFPELFKNPAWHPLLKIVDHYF